MSHSLLRPKPALLLPLLSLLCLSGCLDRGSGSAFGLSAGAGSTAVATEAQVQLATLDITNLNLEPAFRRDVLEYRGQVPFLITAVRVTAGAADPSSQVLVNGKALASGTRSDPIPLALGENVIELLVRATNGKTQTYRVLATRRGNAELSALAVSEGNLSPAFHPATFAYSVSVAFSVTEITLTPKVAKTSTATIQFEGEPLASGATSPAIPLAVGDRAITISVTASDGFTQDYVITVTRRGSPSLAALSVSDGSLSPAFDPLVLAYTVALPFEVSELRVTPTLLDPSAAVEVQGIAVASGKPSAPVSLNPTETTITVSVTSADGLQRTYQIVVTRGPSLKLSSLAVSAGILVPDFDPDVTEYAVDVNFLTPSLTVTAETVEADAVLRVQGTLTTSGSPSQPVPLAVGGTNIDLDLSGEDGSTRNYRVNVNRRSIDTFVQDYLKASNTGAVDLFGASVALSGNTLVVGARGESSSATGVNGNEANDDAPAAGAAYVFTRQGAAWTQQAYLKASNASASDAFGRAVGISGDTIVVGAPSEDSASPGIGGDQSDNTALASGAVYVFVRQGTTWTQQAYIKASNPGAGDGFGTSLTIDGETLVVGAAEEDSDGVGVGGDQLNDNATAAGAVYVFTRDDGDWTQQAYLKATNSGSGDRFGVDVALDGDTLVVGAESEDSNATGFGGDQENNDADQSGATYVFTRVGISWIQEGYLKASNTGDLDQFGSSVALSGTTLVVGARGEDSAATGVNGNENDDSASSAGAAYVFVLDGDVWTQQAYLKASNARAFDGFGLVALSADTLVVAAVGEDSAAQGLQGDEADASAAESGAVYVFTRDGQDWSQQVYLKPSNTESGDLFGAAIALSGDTLVTGAVGESSGSTGPNGDETDNSALASGAVFVRR